MAGKAFIGTSGWIYDEWKDTWYAGIKRKDWLRHSASIFTALEADGTFYRQQKPETYATWAEQTPPEFRFAIRGHRYITHRKRLTEPEEPLRRVREQAEGLGAKLGVVLWQLPPNFHKNLERLEHFASALDPWATSRHAIEFRHNSWFTDEVAEVLARHRLANVLSHAGRFEMWDRVTTDLVYVRLHGAPETYVSDYSPAEIRRWAERVKGWLGEDRDVHVYFDNDIHSHAPRNALELLELL